MICKIVNNPSACITWGGRAPHRHCVLNTAKITSKDVPVTSIWHNPMIGAGLTSLIGIDPEDEGAAALVK